MTPVDQLQVRFTHNV